MEMSAKTDENVSQNHDMSAKADENVSQNHDMSAKDTHELDDEELDLLLNNTPTNKKVLLKKRQRQRGIISLIRQNPKITAQEMAEKLEVKERTIYRDMEELKNIIEYVGSAKDGYWNFLIIKK